jgi:hypothetical protein
VSRTKKLTRARKREAALRAEIEEAVAVRDEAIVGMRQRDTRIMMLLRELYDVEETLRPAVERIAAVRLNDRWFFPVITEQMQYEAVHGPLDFRDVLGGFATTRSIDTHRKLHIAYVVADEVLLEMLERGDMHPIVENYFVRVGTQMLKRAVAATLAAKENRKCSS